MDLLRSFRPNWSASGEASLYSTNAHQTLLLSDSLARMCCDFTTLFPARSRVEGRAIPTPCLLSFNDITGLSHSFNPREQHRMVEFGFRGACSMNWAPEEKGPEFQ